MISMANISLMLSVQTITGMHERQIDGRFFKMNPSDRICFNSL